MHICTYDMQYCVLLYPVSQCFRPSGRAGAEKKISQSFGEFDWKDGTPKTVRVAICRFINRSDPIDCQRSFFSSYDIYYIQPIYTFVSIFITRARGESSMSLSSTAHAKDKKKERGHDLSLFCRVKIDQLFKQRKWYHAAALAGANAELVAHVLMRLSHESLSKEVLLDIHHKMGVTRSIEHYISLACDRKHDDMKLVGDLLDKMNLIYVEKESQLPLARNAIFGGNSFTDDCSKAAAHTVVLAMDAEWKPIAGSPVSILQLSTAADVIILDVKALREEKAERETHASTPRYVRFIRDIFFRKDVLIVGFSLQNDFARFAASIPEVFASEGDRSSELREPRSILLIEDLAVAKGLVEDGEKNVGLSTVVFRALGRKLNKELQISDWSQRPLSSEQLRYAALDAVVCYRLFETFRDDIATGDDWTRVVRGRFSMKRVFKSLRKVRAAVESKTRSLLEPSRVRSCALQAFARVNDGKGNDDDRGARKEKPPTFLDKVVDLSELSSRVGTGETLRLVKTICFIDCKTESHIHIVVLDASDRVDMKQLRVIVGCKMRLASERHVAELVGYLPGSVPAWGHRKRFPTVLSDRLFPKIASARCRLVVGGGSSASVCLLSSEQLARITGGKIATVTQHDGGTPCAKPTIDGVSASGSSLPKNMYASPHIEAKPLGRSRKKWFPCGESGPLRRFVLGREVTKLLRYLRVIGADAAFESGGEEAIFRVATNEGRIVITKDKKLARRRSPCATFLLGSEDPKAQLKEVCNHFGLCIQEETFMSRCSICNTRGFEGPMNAKDIKDVALPGVVPEKVLKKPLNFYVCLNDSCRKVYWRGPKYESTRKVFFSLLLSGDGDDDDPEEGTV